MTKPELFEKLALFHYFLLLDEAKAQSATIYAIKNLRLKFYTQGQAESQMTLSDFVYFTDQTYKKMNRKKMPVKSATGSILLPENSNWGPWFELKKNIDERDFQTLIYAKIMGVSIGDIAEGLKISTGTVRYRLGKAMKRLGHLCNENGVAIAKQ